MSYNDHVNLSGEKICKDRHCCVCTLLKLHSSTYLTSRKRVLLHKLIVAHVVIPCLLQRQKLHYHVHKSLPLDHNMSQMNPVYTLKLCSFKIHFNIIIPPTPRLPSGLFHSEFPTNPLRAFLIFFMCLLILSPHPPFI